MTDRELEPAALFGLDGRVAVVTGGTGAIGAAMAQGLAAAGARVAVLARQRTRVEAVAAALRRDGTDALGLAGDVLSAEAVAGARDLVLDRWGRVDILVNAAGGNLAAATLDEGQAFSELAPDAFRAVVDLNLMGTLLPCQVFAAAMTPSRAADGEPPGCIVNVSSMAAQRAVTRVGGYSAAKAAVENLTRWLAVELARRHGAGLRVNAIAPGFFIGEQNRRLLLCDDGSLTERGQAVIDHTPARRFGELRELVSTLVWLCGPGATFVNGIVVNVDGGFSAFSGV